MKCRSARPEKVEGSNKGCGSSLPQLVKRYEKNQRTVVEPITITVKYVADFKQIWK